MATLADAFLADLEDLEDASEHEEEVPREDAADQEVSAASARHPSKQVGPVPAQNSCSRRLA